MKNIRLKEMLGVLQKITPQQYEYNVAALVIGDEWSEERLAELLNLSRELKYINSLEELGVARIAVLRKSCFEKLPRIWSAVYPLSNEEIDYVK